MSSSYAARSRYYKTEVDGQPLHPERDVRHRSLAEGVK